MLDYRPTAILRARIRLNRHHFNSRQHMLKLADTPNCPLRRKRKTDSHVLFDCPRFALARHLCIADLDFHNVPLSLNLLCGDFSSIPPALAVEDVRAATAKFLHCINKIRPI